MSDVRHNFVVWLVVIAALWGTGSVLIAQAQYEAVNTSGLNTTLNYTDNFSNFTKNVDTGTGLLETLGSLWVSMISIFPLWLQVILGFVVGAIILYTAVTVWTAIGA